MCATRSIISTRQLKDLQLALAEKAEAHAATVMPGFTHLQVAQPVTFGHHCWPTWKCWRATAHGSPMPAGA